MASPWDSISYITLHYITLHTLHTLHHITSHHITSHHITSHHITSHHITLHYITLQYQPYISSFYQTCPPTSQQTTLLKLSHLPYHITTLSPLYIVSVWPGNSSSNIPTSNMICDEIQTTPMNHNRSRAEYLTDEQRCGVTSPPRIRVLINPSRFVETNNIIQINIQHQIMSYVDTIDSCNLNWIKPVSLNEASGKAAVWMPTTSRPLWQRLQNWYARTWAVPT